MAQGQERLGFRLVNVGTDPDLTAFGRNAGGGLHPDHLTAHHLEIGNSDIIGKYYFLDIGEAGTIDGHRLSGHHLGGEEHLDAQSNICRLGFFLDGTGRESTHQSGRENYSYVFKYLLHNRNLINRLEYYQPGFWVRWGFFLSSDCGMG